MFSKLFGKKREEIPAQEETPAVDISRLEVLGDTLGQDGLLQLVEAYIDFSAGTLPDLADAAEKKDYTRIKSHAHSFKGCCDQVGAPQMATFAHQIEMDPEGSIDGSAPTELSNFLALAARVESELRAYMQKANA